MRCKHEWVLEPKLPFPFLICKHCKQIKSLLDIPDEEIKFSFGEEAEALLDIKKIGLQMRVGEV